MTETKESVEPTWQEKLGIKDEKTQQLMEIAGQGVSIFALIWIAGQALAVVFVHSVWPDWLGFFTSG